MNKKSNIIFIVVAIVLLIGIIILSTLANTKDKTIDDNDIYQVILNESNNVSDKEKKAFTRINVSEYLDIFNGEETKIVIVGREGCNYCKIAEPIIQNIMYKYNLDIYYLSTDDFTVETEEMFMSSDPELESFATPLILVVSNGHIFTSYEGLDTTDGYTKLFKEYGFIKREE